MFRLKGCGRCGGDLWMYRDLDGSFWRCLQCGRSQNNPVPLAAVDRGWRARLLPRKTGAVRRSAR